MQYRLAFPRFMNDFDINQYSKPEERYLRCVNNRFIYTFCGYFGLVTLREEKREGSFLSDYFVKKSPLLDQVFELVDYG